ncbi:YraN family protein [Hydrogenophaga sp. PAMC20947]|uniref:YraN family protein n=1 Tax=Hydrogenophaga sp. PAMC20947 TaxID=2565558 RepID=UPI00109E2046|nr:YraN family protein [Hydrogenophaga sp. PAMC20947]QCB47194.1 YraN family protein [Hydrogenophaga sp. PAMC20947]
MGFFRNGSLFNKAPAPAASPALASQARPSDAAKATTKRRGDAAEALALAHLQRQGLRLVQRNFKTPGRGGGEVDLIMRETDGTLVFIEVRQRAGASRGGAGGSITVIKQQRIILAARHFLLTLGSEPPCRFDVVLVEGRLAPDGSAPGARLEWIRAAFDASATF